MNFAIMTMLANGEGSYAGEFAGIEMGDSKALLDDRVVVATTQSICHRLEKWPHDYFSLVIVDEAHRQLGSFYEKISGDRQLITLAKAGFDTDCVSCRGHASKILDLLFMRRENGLASPKQLHWLRRFHYPQPELATFEEAQLFLDEHFNQRAV